MKPLEFLYSLEGHGIKLGLDNIAHLLSPAGDPHRRLPAVHVGGTNGKGSVVAITDAILRAAGYTTGRFTSPHLIDLNERFLINRTPISDAELEGHVAFFRDVAKTMDPLPTFFEVCTAVAFRCFATHAVDAALIEVGMGGRFDSTNVIAPRACAITNVDLEHTRYLGDTLDKIAFEKAGIIKKGVPVILTETRPAPRDVILAQAEERGSPTYLLDRDFAFTTTGGPFELRFSYESDRLALKEAALGLSGTYQGPNAAAAVALAERLAADYPKITRDTIVAGLRDARWPCRFERVLDEPIVLMDVAHNVAGARKLVSELSDCVMIFAVSSDKDAAKMVETLAPVARTLILTRFEGKRAMPLEDLVATVGDRPHLEAPTLADALRMGLSLASASSLPLVITGSIFAAGEARAVLIRDYAAKPLSF